MFLPLLIVLTLSCAGVIEKKGEEEVVVVGDGDVEPDNEEEGKDKEEILLEVEVDVAPNISERVLWLLLLPLPFFFLRIS